jgi:hypothetical protein
MMDKSTTVWWKKLKQIFLVQNISKLCACNDFLAQIYDRDITKFPILREQFFGSIAYHIEWYDDEVCFALDQHA